MCIEITPNFIPFEICFGFRISVSAGLWLMCDEFGDTSARERACKPQRRKAGQFFLSLIWPKVP